MDLERLGRSPIGRLVPITVLDGAREWDFHAFVPDQLPQVVDLASETWKAVVEASSAIARLDGAARRLPNPYLLVDPALAEEAVSTSALEGTYAPIHDVLQAEYLDPSEVSPEVTEIRNSIAAAQLGLNLIHELPICHRLVREVHGRLMLGARGDSSESGSYRSRQNWIGSRRGTPVTEALFVPPPAGALLESGLDDWEAWVNSNHELPVVVRAALAHYQFETLHPFIDGNGRVGRLIALLMFIESGQLTVPLLNLSPYLEEHRDEYVQQLRELSMTGAWDTWVGFFARVVQIQSERALAKADRLVALRQEFSENLHAEGVRGIATRIADRLISSLVITPTQMSEELGVSFPAANKAIARLEELGIVQELTGRSYGRIFASRQVVEIVFGQDAT